MLPSPPQAPEKAFSSILTITIGLLVALSLSLSVMIAGAQRAAGHDVLIESTPETGSTVETSPTEVRLRFSGRPLEGEGLANLVRVVDESGHQWQHGEVTVEDFDLVVGVCEDIPQGEYRIAYRVIYSDGHTGEQALSFTNADPTAPQAGTEPDECGEKSSDAPQASNLDEATDNNSTSGAIPSWVWIAAGAGLLAVIVVVIVVMRGGNRPNTKEN